MKSMVCITGAAGGLGKAFSVECASRGWDLFITDLHEQPLAELSESLRNTYGVKVIYQACDLTNHIDRTRLFDEMQNHQMKFWCLVNIAGLDFEGPFIDRSREQIRTLLRLNIEANIEMTYIMLKRHDPSQTFRIINVASLAAYYPMPIKALYAASKSFILSFSKALREEVRSIGGTVTALCPAGMPTTAACTESIDAQGIVGLLTTTNTGYVASRTIDHALKGHAVYIPGKINQVVNAMSLFIPSTVIAKMINKRWNNVSLYT